MSIHQAGQQVGGFEGDLRSRVPRKAHPAQRLGDGWDEQARTAEPKQGEDSRFPGQLGPESFHLLADPPTNRLIDEVNKSSYLSQYGEEGNNE